MSERLYQLLLQLYPVRFRKEYSEEAMRLFRDRLREETGFFQRLRLWSDLLIDLSVSLPREYRRGPSTLAAVVARSPAGEPLFSVLEEQLPRPGIFLFGTIAAFGALGVFVVLLNSGNKAFPAPSASTLYATSRTFSQATYPGAAQLQAGRSVEEGFMPNDDERRRVIHAVTADLKEYYKHSGAVRAISQEITTREENGDYAAITNGDVFAAVLTKQMQGAAKDPGLELIFNRHRGWQAENNAQPELHRIDEHFAVRIP
jgi:hypothetical protein